jgi:hypothetical protein
MDSFKSEILPKKKIPKWADLDKLIDASIQGESPLPVVSPRVMGVHTYSEQKTSGYLELWRKIDGADMKIKEALVRCRSDRRKTMEAWKKHIGKLKGRWYFVWKPKFG